MRKRFFATLTAAAMVLSLAACSQSGTTTSSASGSASAAGSTAASGASSASAQSFAGTTVTYFCSLQCPDVYKSNADMLCYQMAEKATGIKINWVTPAKGQETEQFNVLLLSNDKPDIMEGNWLNYAGGPDAAIDTKVIQDITDSVKTYMPNYTAYLNKYPDLKKMVLSDAGKLYCVAAVFTSTDSASKTWSSVLDRKPTNETYVGLMIRTDYLQSVNMTAPKTIEEFTSVLKAFKEKLGINTPFSPTLDFLKKSQMFASAYDVVSSGYMSVDGKAVYAPIQSNYKQYLTALHNLYAAGLLDPDFAVQDSTTAQAKVTSNATGLWLGYYSSWGNAFYDKLHQADAASKFDFVGLTNPTVTSGQQLKYVQADWAYRISNGCAAVTTSCKNVGAALTFLDWGWSKEGDLAMNWGEKDNTYTTDSNSWPVLTDKVAKSDPDGLSVATAIQKYTRKNGPLGMDYYNRLILGTVSKGSGLKALETWCSTANGTTPATFPLVTQTSAESAEVSSLTTNIDTYANECYIKFIDGSMSLDSDWDNYVKTIEGMDLAKLTSLKQAALDRYNKR